MESQAEVEVIEAEGAERNIAVLQQVEKIYRRHR